MAISSGQLYGAAAFLVLLIALIILFYVFWYFRWRKRHNKGFQRLPNEQNVVNKTPKIKVNTVEFTLPQGRPYSWAEGVTEYEFQVDEKAKREKASSSECVYPQPGVKTTLGLLKPELYPSGDESDYEMNNDLPPGNIGRVWFNLEYDAQSEKLIVTVDEIRNLPGRQQRSSLTLSSTSSCDPFIRLYLLPDEKRYLQSKMKRKTRNPTFKETFMFTMSYNLLIERTLRITVFDVDRFMRQTIIGHVLYPLHGIDISIIQEEWRDVEKSSQLSNCSGRLQIGLTNFPEVNRVAVNIIRGQGIGTDDSSSPDSYVKITYSVLNKVHKVKKTSVQKNSCEPFYNQTIEFKIDQQGMDVACLNFEVYHITSTMKNNKVIGSFVVGGSLCTKGKELEHWENMIQKPKTVVKEWHDLKI